MRKRYRINSDDYGYSVVLGSPQGTRMYRTRWRFRWIAELQAKHMRNYHNDRYDFWVEEVNE